VVKRFARASSSTTDLIVSRLWNFAAYARRDPCAPDGSCQNPIYQNWIPEKAWEEAWGEQKSADPGYELVVDEEDAEAMEVWIMQLSKPNRSIINRRFVLRVHVPHLEVDAAVRALADLMEQNWAVVDRMEGR
jgi:hypothetical protein